MKKKNLSTSQIIILGFAGVIFLGTLLLMLPFSSVSGKVTSFADALFTSTSAVCVTGLVVKDTATYWSMFGQGVIIALIQIGGLGVVTVAISLARLSKRKIGLMQRSLMQDSISAHNVGGIVEITGFILKTALIIELIGALVMMPVFCRDFGLRGIWYAFFHSISAFCNAGFDLMGTTSEFSSLTSYYGSGVINSIVMLLIVVGGIGFFVWDDIRTNKLRFKKYRLQTKVVLVTSAVLIILPAVYFFFFEFGNLAPKDRVFASVFQSVTARTAGFNTADLTLLSGVGQAIMIILMLIGGSPGSTAGGMKTTTIAVLVFSSFAVFRRREDVECFGRRVEKSTINNAAAILLMYAMLFLGGGFIISIAEQAPLSVCLYESASAIGTVGLSLGMTPGLGMISKAVLIVLMFWGRVGGLTLIFAAVSGSVNTAKKPQEKITVG